MRFQILVAIAAVTQIASLREEVARLELEVGHEEVQLTGEKVQEQQVQVPVVQFRNGTSPVDKQNKEPTAIIPAEAEGFFEVSHANVPEHPQEWVELTQQSCLDGVVNIKGHMEVKEKLEFPQDCKVLRGEPGSEVVLEAGLEFEGALRFEGDLRLRAASAFEDPCIYVEGEAVLAGNLLVSDCHNKDPIFGGQGGGLKVDGALEQRSGTAEFRNCSTEYGSGGGLFAYGSLTQHGGTLTFSGCSSLGDGGGLFAHGSLTQHGGTLTFSGCSSLGDGGGMYAYKTINQTGGAMHFENCRSEDKGGGMDVLGKYIAAGVSVFDSCAATTDGGGLWVKNLEQANTGNFNFRRCTAMRGGGMYALTATSQNLYFDECAAAESGGGLQIAGEEGSFLSSTTFTKCSAARATGMEARNVTVKHVELIDTFEKAIVAQSLHIGDLAFVVKEGTENSTKPTAAIEGVNLTIDSELNCTGLSECHLVSPASSPPNNGPLWCGQGTGVPKPPSFGCWACPEGYTQTERETNGSCLECPSGTALCRAGKIIMSPGLMIHDRNLSRPLHCPTKAACRGGELPPNQSNPMCQPGYGGEGCAQCTNSNGAVYKTADSSVLACTQCANETAIQLLQWSSFLAQRSILFAVSAASIFGAGNANAVKSSGVYLNQLMAFAAVSGSVITVVMQTDTAEQMKFSAAEYLFGTAVFLSEAGSGQGSRSSHCLLSYISLDRTGLQGVHLLDVAIATILVLVLSMKDFRVALVAGMNCFLPGILADFAKYAVCYSLEEEVNGKHSMRCDNLPFNSVFGFVLVGVGFLAVFTVALFVWIRLSTPDVKGEGEVGEVPSHVAFLTNKYNKGCRYFEAERLVRKVLLTTAAAFYPSSVFPKLQMTALLVITTASMLMYSIFQPYSRAFWNISEFALLATALLLISLASAVLGNEGEWDKTDLGQKSMIVTLGAIVTGICSAFMIKIAFEVWGEKQTAQQSR